MYIQIQGIKRYDLHPSILGIKEHVSKEVFSFSNVSLQEVEFEIKCQCQSKHSQEYSCKKFEREY